MAIRWLVLLLVACLTACVTPDGRVGVERWQDRLARTLPRLGHRNWIVIADAAYPAQSRPGIETWVVGGDQLEAVRAALEALDASSHVRPKILVDAELEHVGDTNAPGIADYRQRLAALLAGRDRQQLPHEQVITKLDDAARLFEVLVIKTDGVLPYTSVFLELDCGYWSTEAEDQLRTRMGRKG